MIPATARPQEPPDLVVHAPAKVNLFLEVLRKREDGYHQIETVMQAIDLCDRLEFWKRAPGTLTISVSGREAPANESNLAFRAARIIMTRGQAADGLHIHLDKRIPAGGGLGGGSSDAAACLDAVNRLLALEARAEDLAEMAALLGSDVNFFLTKGLALCHGRGEIVEPVDISIPLTFLLWLPQTHVLTKDAYHGLGEIPLTRRLRSSRKLLDALAEGNWKATASELFNRLEHSVLDCHHDLAEAKQRMDQPEVLGTLLSGSGSTIFALTPPNAAHGLAGQLAGELRSGELLLAKPSRG